MKPALEKGRSVLTGKVLVLNQSYEPITVCSAKKAMILIFLMKAEIVETYKDRFIRSVSQAFPFPSVIRLSAYIRVPFKQIELSRKNILRRDNFQCQYCGKKSSVLTIDHILPKSRGGGDTWENLITACVKCNNIKGSRTPGEAGMKLLSKPQRPHHIVFFKQFFGNVEDNWKPFLFMQ
ncbi:MAG: HNH endonuclease [Candidatus Kapaibacterium sp.]